MNNDSQAEVPTKKTIWFWLKRAFIAFVVTLLVAATCSAIWHSRRTKWAEKENPPLGKFIDVSGHNLHFHIRGQGPSVVMDSGNGDAGSYGWFGLENDLSDFCRVLTYDRAGVGWSEPGPSPRASDREVEELRELLHHTDLPSPYILVGHSRGGFNMRLYASKYPHEVAGLVLIDAFCSDTFPDDTPMCSLAPFLKVVHAGRHFGMARLFYMNNLVYKSPNIEAERVQRYIDMQGRTSNFDSFVEQSTSQANWLELRSQMRNLGEMPVTVITAKLTDDRYGWTWWPSSQRALAANVGENVEVLEPNCGHYVHAEQPELVIDAVKRMIDRVGAKKEAR